LPNEVKFVPTSHRYWLSYNKQNHSLNIDIGDKSVSLNPEKFVEEINLKSLISWLLLTKLNDKTKKDILININLVDGTHSINTISRTAQNM